MTDGRSVDERLDAVERAVTDGHAADGLPEAASVDARLDELEATVEDIDDRVTELEAAVQALRGFAGGVRAVDESVERRANAAIARVERLEAEVRDDAASPPNDGRVASGGNAAPDPTGDDPPSGVGRRDTAVSASGDGPEDGALPAADASTDAALAEAAAARADDRMATVDTVSDDAPEDTDRSLGARLRQLL